MKMEAYYVVRLYDNDVAEYVAGPFRFYSEASDEKEVREKDGIDYNIVATLVKVDLM